ncbi:MAG TPA: NUDIX hydrolase [Bacteroidales bacterium]|nr:NUDIX hydrolase [Bacteroidales bacterium]HRW33611.1 NUDIX hydrolase [Thermotogota bacterium]
MNRLTEKEIDREYKYKGQIINVRVDRVLLENGKESKREIVEHNGAVAILPIDEKGNCTLVEQFRKPIEKILLEVPAGKLDLGENPLTCAKRELLEETGLTAKTLIPLGSIFTTAGFSNEQIYLFLGFDLQQQQSIPDEDEFLNIVRMKWSKLLQLSQENLIDDAKTNVLILRALPKVKKYLTDK